VFNGFWGLDDARRHRDRLFLFGDNDARRGLAGQAVIRDEPNAVGLATKRSPSHVAHAYYRCGDALAGFGCPAIAACQQLTSASRNYGVAQYAEPDDQPLMSSQCLSCRDEDFEANAAKISAGVVRVLHALLEGYMPDGDAHPGAHAGRDSSARPAVGPAAAGGCAAAAGRLPEPPVPASAERQQQHQQQQQVRLPLSCCHPAAGKSM
jgi:hypothetical protein